MANLRNVGLAAAVCLALVVGSNAQIKRPPPPRRPPPPPPILRVNCTFLSGGATSISSAQEGLFPASTSGFSAEVMSLFDTKLSNTTFGKYYAVGSTRGVTYFINGTFCTAFSDDTMSVLQENAFASQFPSPDASASAKLTIPAVIAGYGFFANAGSVTFATDAKTKAKISTQTIRLTGVDLYNVYYGKSNTKTYKWNFNSFQSAPNTLTNKTDASFLGSQIKPYSRDAGSGTTQLIKGFFQVVMQAAQLAYDGATLDAPTGNPFPATWTTSGFLASGTSGLCTTAASVLGAITYSQKSVCVNKLPLIEVKILNKAGFYIASTDRTANYTTAIPTTVPAYDKPWSAVTLLFQNGAQTPPIVSFVYLLVRKQYPRSQFLTIKKFGAWLTSANQTLAGIIARNGLIAISPSRRVEANTAINTFMSSY